MNTEQFDIEGEYAELHRRIPMNGHMPFIGISANFREGDATLAKGYYLSILKSGGIPLIIPPYPYRPQLTETLDKLDGIVLSGGADIDPRYMGETPDYELLHEINPERDEQEMMLVKLASDRQIPILGICRGIQTIAAALGGKVHQDIYSALGDNLLVHSQKEERWTATHSINIVQDSLLHDFFGDTIQVNSFHHQAVSSLPSGFRVTAMATGGVIEAIEAIDGRKIIGVQWHPECFILKDENRCMMPLFEWFVSEAQLHRKAKELHEHIITIDSHCDTPMLFDKGYDFGIRSKTALVDMHKMHEGHLDCVIMAAYLKQESRDEASLSNATRKAWKILDEIDEKIGKYSDYTALCDSPEKILEQKRKGKKTVMKAIENGYAIGQELSCIERFRKSGVVYMTLCHNGDNDICDSAKGMQEHNGLSRFGRKVVSEMNRVGMIIDLSHASEKTFYDVLEASSAPVVCSHSSCRALCNHPRNLTDNQLKAIAQKGGVVQITLYSGFLTERETATLKDLINHIEHAVKTAGINHVGIGTDFDGDGSIIGCSDTSQLINITKELLRKGYSHDDIEKIWGGNWLRVMKEVQDKSKK